MLLKLVFNEKYVSMYSLWIQSNKIHKYINISWNKKPEAVTMKSDWILKVINFKK